MDSLIKCKYGKLSRQQLYQVERYLQKSIFFLLLYVDPKTKKGHENIDVDKAFIDVQNKIIGLNGILNNPPRLVIIMALLERAYMLYSSGESGIQFDLYRKLVLDAGAEVMKIDWDYSLEDDSHD